MSTVADSPMGSYDEPSGPEATAEGDSSEGYGSPEYSTEGHSAESSFQGGYDNFDAPGAQSDPDPEGTSAAALAHARATTIVPGGRQRSRRRGRGVPAQRNAPDDSAPAYTGETDQTSGMAEPVEHHIDDLSAQPIAQPIAQAVTQTPPAAPGTLSEESFDDSFDESFDDPYGESYTAPEGFIEPDDRLLGATNVTPRRGSRSAAWRLLGALRPRRRRSPDDETWPSESESPIFEDAGPMDHWTQTEDLGQAGEIEYTGQDSQFEDLAWAPAAQLEFSAPAPSGSAFVPAPSAPATVAAVVQAEPTDKLALDREALRSLGLPAAWTRHLPSGDRFTSIVQMLERLPELEIADDISVIAVVGPADVVELEAHRTALDLPADGRPRTVATVPAGDSDERRSAVAQSKRTRPVVVAIEVDGYADPAETRKLIAAVKAESVIAVVDASRPLEETTRWVEALESVDALAVDGALETSAPAAILGLDVPVIRVDGIAVDRIGWAALLCAQLAAIDAQRDSTTQ